MAVSHADMTLKNHFRMDGSSYHVVDYDMRTGKVRSRCTAQDIPTNQLGHVGKPGVFMDIQCVIGIHVN